jgi:hypothetical protein
MKNWRNHSLHARTRANIPTSPYGSRRFKREWNTRNRRTEAGMNYRSDILHLRPGRKLSGKRLSPHGRSGRRRAASRNQGNWVAAIAGAMTWLRVSSSGGIGDAVSVSVNAMGRRPGRGRRRSRNSSNTSSDEWPGSKWLGLFRLWLVDFRVGGPSGLDEPVLCLQLLGENHRLNFVYWHQCRAAPKPTSEP